MESCFTVAVSSELAYTFPTLMDLSAKVIVAVWDAVSDFIMEQMKLNKGVLVPGLGIFAVVQEEFHSKELAVPVRRPVFQLDIGVIWLKDLQSPNDIIPDDVKIELLNYRQLGGVVGISMHKVKRCVQETILLYWHLLKSKADVSFFFKNIGVMTCHDNFLCMRFFHSCVKTLESKASIIAMLHTRTWPKHYADVGPETIADGIHMLPRFQLTMKMSREEAAAYGARKMSRVGPGGRLLQRQKSLPPSMLLLCESGSRQQDMAKKPSASVLPPCAGSSRGTKKAGQKEALTAAQTRAALPVIDDNKRVLQELREVSASRKKEDSTRSMRPVYRKQIEQEQAKRAAWDAWSAEKDQHAQQSFARVSVQVPHPPAQPKGQQVRRWRKDVEAVPGDRLGASTKLVLHANLLPPRAAQVLRKLELHIHQQESFASAVEKNRKKLELKRQLPCVRCSRRSRVEGAANSGDHSGAPSMGAGKLSSLPPLNGKP